MLIKMGNEKEQPGDHLDGRAARNYRYGFHQTHKGGKIFGCERCIFSSGVHSCSLSSLPSISTYSERDTRPPNQEEDEKEIPKNFLRQN